ILRQRIITESAHAFWDTDVKLAFRFDAYLKNMLSILRLFRGNYREFNSLGLLEDIVRDIGRALPFRRIIRFCRLFGLVLFRSSALPVFVAFATLIRGSRIGAF